MKRALLVIDVQNEYFTGRLLITHPAGSLENILKAMDLASERSIPVVIVQHNSSTFRRGTPEWELHPEVARRPRDLLLHKRLPGSFTGTDLDEWLRGHGVDTVAISGYMTHMCCDSTARQAFHRGFSVEFLSDATGTLALKNEGGEVTADELYRATLVAQAMVFSRVLSTGEWQSRLG